MTFLDTDWSHSSSLAVVLPRITAEEGKLRLGGGAAFAPEGVFFLNDTQERAVLFLLGEAETPAH